ncbi:unnamed protein product [Phytomonas sp. Hart1]|nr:unnamed protein product [Phytomonas sp. Hart1]|eukprot:CCW66066.1 unnamed protein product [Phytomonas sp. isolate Hart1]
MRESAVRSELLKNIFPLRLRSRGEKWILNNKMSVVDREIGMSAYSDLNLRKSGLYPVSVKEAYLKGYFTRVSLMRC